MAIMKKGMGKPMKKAQNGAVTKKKPAKTYPILSEEGDLADALNETARMRSAGKAPKTSAGGMKVMDKFQKEGKLGPAKPKMQRGGKLKSDIQTAPKKKATVPPTGTFRSQSMTAPKMAKSGASMKKAQMGASMVSAPMMKKGGSMKKCKYGCK